MMLAPKERACRYQLFEICSLPMVLCTPKSETQVWFEIALGLFEYPKDNDSDEKCCN